MVLIYAIILFSLTVFLILKCRKTENEVKNHTEAHENDEVKSYTEDQNEETSCKLVCSRGLMKSCDFYPLIPVSSTLDVYPYDFEKINQFSAKYNQYPSIYINTSAIPNFCKIFFNQIKTKFILVSGDADETVYEDVFESYYDFLNFIEEERIIKWFAQNATVSHSKLIQIPIGLDYHTLSLNSHHIWGEKLSPLSQERMLMKIGSKSPPLEKRKFKIYASFHFSMESKHASYDRKDAYLNLPKDLVYYEKTPKNREESWKTQSKYVFVASPFGNGFDCHRTWEALALGCIPIIKTSGLDTLYKQFPICIVNDWKEVDISFLTSEYKKIIEMLSNYYQYSNHQNLVYWTELIKSLK